MKAIKYIVLLAAFLPLKSMANTDSTAKAYFYAAKQHLEDMLTGKEKMSYEEAIYQIENAWWEGTINRVAFGSTLDNYTSDINKLILRYTDSARLNPVRDLLETKEQKVEKYRKALANFAIYQFFTKPIISIDGNMIIYRKPYSYPTKDPFGTSAWKNTQVVNLLDNNVGNCFALSSLFKIFSERLHSDASLTTAPGHIYIRHADEKGTRFNVELSSHSFPGTGTLETLTYTPDEATKNGIALRELDLKQSITLCLVYLAKGYEYKFGTKDDLFMLACSETALQYDDHNLNAMLLKAEVMENRFVKQNKAVTELKANKEFQDYQSWITHIFKYGYREMPFEMKNIMIKGWTRDTIITLSQQDHTPSRLKHATLKDTRYAGVSWGLFDEEIKTKPLERFGNTVFDTKKKVIVGFLKDDVLYNHYNFDPVVFAWNVDPLAKSFPSISPYIFAQNSPIAMIDREGKHGEIVIDKGVQESGKPQLYTITAKTVYVANNENLRSASGNFDAYGKFPSEHDATLGRKTFSGTSNGVAYNARFKTSFLEYNTSGEANAVIRKNPVFNLLSFNTSRATSVAGGNNFNYNINQHNKENTFGHEDTHTWGEAGDHWGNDYLSSYTLGRQFQDQEANDILGPAIQLAQKENNSKVIIRVFADENGDGKYEHNKTTYKVYDPECKTYGASITIDSVNPKDAPASK